MSSNLAQKLTKIPKYSIAGSAGLVAVTTIQGLVSDQSDKRKAAVELKKVAVEESKIAIELEKVKKVYAFKDKKLEFNMQKHDEQTGIHKGTIEDSKSKVWSLVTIIREALTEEIEVDVSILGLKS